jgi:hypothetical protein
VYSKLVTEEIPGSAVVTVLLNPDGTLTSTRLAISPRSVTLLTVSEMQFAPFGFAAGVLRYLGVARVQSPLKTVLVIFGALDSPSKSAEKKSWD